MFSLCQLALLGWQTDIIKWLKDKAGNDRLGPNFGVWKPEQERWPGYYEEYWMTGKEKHYLGEEGPQDPVGPCLGAYVPLLARLRHQPFAVVYL